MGHASSCFADNTTDEKDVRIDLKDRSSLHPLSSQDAEICRSRAKTMSSESVKSINMASSKDTIETTDLSFSSRQQKQQQQPQKQQQQQQPQQQLQHKSNSNSNSNSYSRDVQFISPMAWDKFSVLKEEEDMLDDKSEVLVSPTYNTSNEINRMTIAKINKQRKLRFRWKKKETQVSKSITNGIITLRVDPLEKTMYYFAKDKNTCLKGNNVLPTSRRTPQQQQLPTYNGRDSNQASTIMEYTGAEQYITKLVTKDETEVKNKLIAKISIRGNKKETYIEPELVEGTQIFATRFKMDDNKYVERPPRMESATKTFTIPSPKRLGRGSKSPPFISVEDVNPNKANNISNENLSQILKRRQNMNTDQGIPKEGRTNRFKAKKLLESRVDLSPTKGIGQGELLSATVPTGVSRKLFADKAVLETDVEPVSEMFCVNDEHKIYVCDIGLTSSRCDFIRDASERCSKGSYNAYTYAKQTLGCREYDELAVVCEWPIMRAISSIRKHLEKKEMPRREGEEKGKIFFQPNKRKLVLDDREPHIVKYDTSRRERQKLDMHTDKSEWTFLIALTDGVGDDYDGGGTYFECIDSTVHLEKGHVLIFPGRLRHRGQKIISGKRFLLVGFLIERKEEWEKV